MRGDIEAPSGSVNPHMVILGYFRISMAYLEADSPHLRRANSANLVR
jgi:hypothetical protein